MNIELLREVCKKFNYEMKLIKSEIEDETFVYDLGIRSSDIDDNINFEIDFPIEIIEDEIIMGTNLVLQSNIDLEDLMMDYQFLIIWSKLVKLADTIEIIK